MLQFSVFGLILPCFLFLFLLIKIFNAHATKSSNNQPKLPPGPKKLPFIGNLHQLIGPGLPHNRLSNLAKIYGPIYHLIVGELSLIFLTTPEVVQEALKAQEIHFMQRPQFPSVEMMNPKNSSVIFAPYGEYWRQLRKIFVSELLSIKQVQSFRSFREDEMGNLVKYVRRSRGHPFNLSEKIFSCMISIIAKAAFGESCKRKEEFLLTLTEARKYANGFSLVDIFPSLTILSYLSGMKWKLDRVRQKFDEIMEDILVDHKRQRESSISQEGRLVREDVVDVLLRIQGSAEPGLHLTTDNIKGVLQDLFTAGSDTVTVTVEWAMSELIKKPRVMAKAQAEMREVLKEKGHVQETDLQELKYLKSVIKETLRLHPPVPLIPREARESCKVHGYDVPMKSRVFINAWAIGRDPNYWENPESFEPERFLESSTDFAGTHYQFLPFGTGRRVCPGIAFASANMELLLALLLYHFDWTLPDGQALEGLDMTETLGAAIKRKNELFVIATPHSRDTVQSDGS